MTKYDLPKAKSRGFTLVELMVVIGIIILISSLVIVNVNASRIKARDARRIADMGTISSALAAYYADNHFYPNLLSDLTPTYINSIPTDPKTHAAYTTWSVYPTSPACTTALKTCTCYTLINATLLEVGANNPLDGASRGFGIKNGEQVLTGSCP